MSEEVTSLAAEIVAALRGNDSALLTAAHQRVQVERARLTPKQWRALDNTLRRQNIQIEGTGNIVGDNNITFVVQTNPDAHALTLALAETLRAQPKPLTERRFLLYSALGVMGLVGVIGALLLAVPPPPTPTACLPKFAPLVVEIKQSDTHLPFDFAGRKTTALAYDTKADRVWAGTIGGLAYFEHRDAHWYPVTTPANFQTVNALAGGSDGTLWAGYQQGLLRIRPDGSQTIYRTPDVSALTVSSDGKVWIGYARSILYAGSTHIGVYDSVANSTWMTWTDTSGAPAFNVATSLAYRASDQTVWLGTNMGVRRVDTHANTWTAYTTQDSPRNMPTDDVYVVAPLTDGRIWIGVAGGDMILDDHGTAAKNDDQWEPADRDRRGPDKEHSSAIASESNAVVWVGARTGLWKRYSATGCAEPWSRVKAEHGLTNERVSALVVDQREQRHWLWIGTFGGLYLLQMETTAP